MKVLVLRTFAHSLVWERSNDFCEFEPSQLNNMIYSWEPGYSNFSLNDFSFALGIYTKKYFTYKAFISNQPVFKNTKEEQTISLLRLRSIDDKNKFTKIQDDGTILVFYKFEKKLWDNPNKFLMSKIDDLLINEKMTELKKSFNQIPYVKFKYPLSFSLDEESVQKILENNNVIKIT